MNANSEQRRKAKAEERSVLTRQKLTLKVEDTTKRRLRGLARTLGFNNISRMLDHLTDLLYASMIYDLLDRNVLTEKDLEILPKEDLELLSKTLKNFSEARIKQFGAGKVPHLPYKKVKENG